MDDDKFLAYKLIKQYITAGKDKLTPSELNAAVETAAGNDLPPPDHVHGAVLEAIRCAVAQDEVCAGCSAEKVDEDFVERVLQDQLEYRNYLKEGPEVHRVLESMVARAGRAPNTKKKGAKKQDGRAGKKSKWINFTMAQREERKKKGQSVDNLFKDCQVQWSKMSESEKNRYA